MKYRLTIYALLIVSIALGQNRKGPVFENTELSVKKIKTNTVASDFGPSIVENNLIFSSYKDELLEQAKAQNPNNQKIFYDIFFTELNEKGEIISKRTHFQRFSTQYHEGPVSYCPETGEMFITQSNFIEPDTLYSVFRKASIHLRIVIAKKVEGQWAVVESFPFNNKRFSVGHPAINATGDTLYFSSNMPENYYITPATQKERRKKERNFKTIAPNIYRSIRIDGKWQTPEPLDGINTEDTEMFPFINTDGVLTFASDGYDNGVGGLDLYYSNPEKGDYKKAHNLGAGVNTPDDDFALVIHPNQSVGFFTSNRPDGEGEDDVYQLDIADLYYNLQGVTLDDYTYEPVAEATVKLLNDKDSLIAQTKSDTDGNFELEVLKDKMFLVKANKLNYVGDQKTVQSQEYVELFLKGVYKLELTVLDKENNEPVPDAQIFINNDIHFLQPDKFGHLMRYLEENSEYAFTATKPGYLKQTINITTINVPYGIIRDTIYMFKKEMDKVFVLDDIYYNFDKWDILPESEIELDKLVQILRDNPEMKVELGSHTDSRGSDSYNMWLSQKRSESAVRYVISRGIEPERIVAKGYGETKLINKCDDGVSCPEVEHRKNRRTEFKIIGLGGRKARPMIF